MREQGVPTTVHPPLEDVGVTSTVCHPHRGHWGHHYVTAVCPSRQHAGLVTTVYGLTEDVGLVTVVCNTITTWDLKMGPWTKYGEQWKERYQL